MYDMILIYKYLNIYIIKYNNKFFLVDNLKYIDEIDDIKICNCLLDLNNLNNVYDVRAINFINDFKYCIYFDRLKDVFCMIDIFCDIFKANEKYLDKVLIVMSYYLSINSNTKLDIDRVFMYNNMVQIDNYEIKYNIFNKYHNVIPSVFLDENVLFKSVVGLNKSKFSCLSELMEILYVFDVNYINNKVVYYKNKEDLFSL